MIDAKTKNLIKSVSALKRSVEGSTKKRTNVMMSDSIKTHLKSKYGTVSNGINILALKDMGEL